MRPRFVLLTLFVFLISVVSLSSRTSQNFAENSDDAYSIPLVENLLKYPSQLGAGFSERQVNRLGDRVSIALLKILREDELSNPQKVKSLLPLIRAAFLYPNLISIADDRKPKVTMFLLRNLERDARDARLKAEISQLMNFVTEKTKNL
jgi:hypothetical protein